VVAAVGTAVAAALAVLGEAAPAVAVPTEAGSFSSF